MKVTGGCHCGAITYEAEVDPSTTGVCHCTDCQKFSGSAFRTGVNAAAKDFHLLTGEPRTYVKTAESGAKRAQAFCGQCGTHIYATSATSATSADPVPAVLRIRTATTDQAAALVPKAQIWTRSALPWLAGLQALPRREMQ